MGARIARVFLCVSAGVVESILRRWARLTPLLEGRFVMRSTQYLLAAALTLGLSLPAFAQGTATTQPVNVGETVTHWTATGFVGSNFNSGAPAPQIDLSAGGVEYGGALAYLWHGVVGGEFLASFAPNLDVTSALVENNPHVNTYMANVIAALPIGVGGHVQPYFSGGAGGIHMAADVFALNQAGVPTADFTSNHEMRWGWDLGGGAMAFANDRIGVRGDVRYYKASVNNQINSGSTPQDVVVQEMISGLHFWRVNGGVTFRW